MAVAAILELSGVRKSFGSIIVADDQSWSLNEGEALGVLGPNGAGKTSMFNLVTGTLGVDGGTIRYDGKDITSWSAARRCRAGISRSFQVPQPFGAMTIYENAYVAAVHGAGLPAGKAEATCLDVLARTGLITKANSLAGGLTLLDRKRLELARAMCAKPRVLLLDEIAGGLTENECHALIETIKELRKTGVSIVWIEHVVHALMAVVDRLIVIDFGRKIADGEPHAVMDSRDVKEIYLGVEADA